MINPKQFACALCAVSLFSFTSRATDICEKASVKTTYYGTKASTNPNNPCSGDTVRKCAEVVTDLLQKATNVQAVVTYNDPLSDLVFKHEFTIIGDLNYAIQKVTSDLPSNTDCQVVLGGDSSED
jgi:hypothetical protein